MKATFKPTTIIFFLITIALVLSACAHSRNADLQPGGSLVSDTYSDSPELDKISEAIVSSPEFKEGGTLRSVRVYFDNSIIGMRITEKYPDEEDWIKYKTEHGLEGYADTKIAIISETIRDEITAILASHGISADAGTMQFGTTFAHVTISAMEYSDLISLRADERVTKISSLDEGQLLKIDEASLKKTADDCEFDRILIEALPDDEFEVCVLLDFISDDELAKPSQEELERMAEEYAAQKVGYAYSDIERLVKEVTVVDAEHGKEIYDPTEEQNAKIGEMIDAYRAARNEFYSAHQTYTLTDEENEIVQKRFDAFLDSNGFDFGEGIHRGSSTLTGKISAADIERLLAFDEVCSVSLLEPVIKFSFSKRPAIF